LVIPTRFWLSRPVIWENERLSSGEALLRLRNLPPGLYLVLGEAGVGKSAFLDYLARGLGYYHHKHRHCPAPWRTEGPPDDAWQKTAPWRRRWVVLGESSDPAAWQEAAREHPVLIALASDQGELQDPPGLRFKIHLPALKPPEAEAFLYHLARQIERRYRKLPPRQRPTWARAYLQAPDAFKPWAQEAAERLRSPVFSGLSVPLFLKLWAETFPPGQSAPQGLRPLTQAMLQALAEHAGLTLPLEAAKAFARLRPRPWIAEQVLKEAGLIEDVLRLTKIGVARRYCPDCYGFSHPLFAGYFLAEAEPPTSEDDLFAWIFYLEPLPREKQTQALLKLPCRKALWLARRLDLVLGDLYKRLCRETLSADEGRLALALDPETPYEVLEELAQDPLLRWAVAANPGAPRELLEWIREQTAHENAFTRRGLARLVERRLADRR